MIRSIGFAIAGLMGIGAIFGAVNTMYNAVASRTREIATLRALGFGSLPVVFSVLAEASCLADCRIIGGCCVARVRWLPDVDDELPVVQPGGVCLRRDTVAARRALAYAILMGLAGGLLPAVRAARLPIVTALRQL